MQPLDWLIVSAATFYLAYSLTLLEGPFKAFVKVRFWLPLGGLTKCIYCMALWVGAACYLAYLTPLQPVVVVLAIAGLGMFVYRFSGGEHV